MQNALLECCVIHRVSAPFLGFDNTTEIFIAQSQNNVFKIFFNANHQKQPYRGDLQSSCSPFMVQKLEKYLRKSSIFVKLQAYSRSGEQLQGRTAFCRTPIFAEHLLVGPSESWGGPFFMKIKYLKTLILEYIPLRGNFLTHGRVK